MNIHEHIAKQAALHKQAMEENAEPKKKDPLLVRGAKKVGKAGQWMRENPGKTAAGVAALSLGAAKGIHSYSKGRNPKAPKIGSGKPSKPGFKPQSVKDFLKSGSQNIHDHIMEQAELCKQASQASS